VRLETSFARACGLRRLEPPRRENEHLRQEINIEAGFEAVVGRSPALRRALEQAAQVADTPASVLLLGETGTGKDLIARAIHSLSPRRERAFVRVNCAALPPSLVESELFGYEKGAFTGATSSKPGRFELAHEARLPRRGRRAPDRVAGQAAARPPGRRVRAAGRRADAQGRRAHHRRDEP
jgi:transcriptional regulator with GAF, ATPase, and Fis domain